LHHGIWLPFSLRHRYWHKAPTRSAIIARVQWFRIKSRTCFLDT
jgi:hypothetical protein